MYAAQIWSKRFAADPLSRCGHISVCGMFSSCVGYLLRSAGDMLWRHMLIYGSGRDPKEMLHDLAGGELDPRHFLDTVLLDDEEEEEKMSQ
jgi:hypothetical protein